MKSSLFFFVLFLGSAMALAKAPYLKSFRTAYPDSKLNSCVVCHSAPGKFTLNPYGNDWVTKAEKKDFVSIEGLDSDGDTFKNLEEITASSFPGDPKSVPGSSGGASRADLMQTIDALIEALPDGEEP